MGTWNVETWSGAAASFHGLDLPAARTVWVMAPDGDAIVLGSSQHSADIDGRAAAARRATVARRRSGGGAVWVDAVSTLWIDIVIPRGDALWVDDVPTSMVWLGEVFAGVVGNGAAVHRDRYVVTDLARAYCFGGLAAGEVTGPHGKIVGISQRRTRDLARFQCVAYTSYDPVAVATLFADPGIAAGVARTSIQTLDTDMAGFIDQLVSALPA